MNPLQLWMQFAEQWQKGSAEVMKFWATGGQPPEAGRPRRR
jgi:hypothetical protein